MMNGLMVAVIGDDEAVLNSSSSTGISVISSQA